MHLPGAELAHGTLSGNPQLTQGDQRETGKKKKNLKAQLNSRSLPIPALTDE